ncbi:MAG: low molecular weight protein arginine phosphatase [bacterium]
MAKRFTILFVCTGNTCRSPMAEGALRMLLDKERPGRAEVISAGIAAGEGFPATFYAQEAALVWDVDISGHQSQPLTSRLVGRADLIFAMSPRHHRQVLRLDPDAADRTFLFKSFPDNSPDGDGVEDPIGQPLDRYNQAFLEIGEWLGRHLDEIVKRIDENSDGN